MIIFPIDFDKNWKTRHVGIGSGSWYRWDKKTTVEDGLTLDLCKLIRQKLIIPCSHVKGPLIWMRVSDGERTASIGYEANLLDPYGAWIRLSYTNNDKPLDYKVRLTTTRPHYGGLRWWFVCPSSGRRAAKLYLPPGGDIFASRKAYGLVYHSQQESPMFRYLTQAQNIRERLGGSTCTFDFFPDKPKGMHWKTYWKLRAKSERAAYLANAAAASHFDLMLYAWVRIVHSIDLSSLKNPMKSIKVLNICKWFR